MGLGKYYKEWTHDELFAVKSDVRIFCNYILFIIKEIHIYNLFIVIF